MKIIRLLPLSLFATGCASQSSTTAAAATPSAATSVPPASNPHAQQAVAPAATPEAIAIPSRQQVLLKASAKGVQIYACKAKEGAPAVYEWTLKAPEADLFDDQGHTIGKHYAGPTWESIDGSKVVGKLRSKVDAPDPTAIPWLLLDAKSTEGTGVLSNVKNIQRVETSGGRAPANGCDAAHGGAETRVDYAATYYMYGP
jgi:hypothetical protein